MTFEPVTTSRVVLQTYINKKDDEKKVIDQKLLKIVIAFMKQWGSHRVNTVCEFDLFLGERGAMEAYCGPHSYKSINEKKETVIGSYSKQFPEVKQNIINAVAKKDPKHDPEERMVIIEYKTCDYEVVPIVKMHVPDETEKKRGPRGTAMDLIPFAISHFNKLDISSLENFHTSLVNEIQKLN